MSTRGLRRLAVAAALLLAIVAAACGGAGPDPGSGAAASVPVASNAEPVLPVSVDSADGRRVTVPAADRIVVLNGGIAEIVVALGLADRVVGRDVSTTIEELADRPLVTRAHDVSAESVLSLRPDVVLADTDSGPADALEQLRATGTAVVVFDVAASVGDVGPRIRDVGAALGVGAAADRVAADTVRAIAAAADGVRRERQAPTVAFLYLRGAAGVYLLGGPGSGADSMLDAAGARDAGTVAGLDRSFTPLTAEALVDIDPDLYLLTTTGLESVGGIEGLLAMPGLAQTTAGRDRRIVTIEDGLLYSFGTRSPDAVRQLAEAIHSTADARRGDG